MSEIKSVYNCSKTSTLKADRPREEEDEKHGDNGTNLCLS